MPAVYEMTEIFSELQRDSGTALGRVRPFVTEHLYSDRARYLSVLGLFGAAGGPEVFDWRADQMPGILEELALRGLEQQVEIYNPRKPIWTPEDAITEAKMFARAAAIIVPVLDLTPGLAGLGETGFAALGGMSRPQKVSMLIESGDDHDEVVRRARSLTTLLATKTLKDFPLNVRMVKDLESLVKAGVRDICDFAEGGRGRIKQESRYVIERRSDLTPKIALVGSGARRYDDSWYQGMGRQLRDYGVPSSEQYSAFVQDWSLDDAIEELGHKTNDASILFVATEDQDSFAAMGELGWLLTYCTLNGQKLGVYVEKHKSDPTSDQNRQRRLAMAHLGRLLLDFPDLPVFVARSPSELARYGAAELAKYKQLQSTCNIARMS